MILDLGAYDFIEKPFDVDIFIDKVKTGLNFSAKQEETLMESPVKTVEKLDNFPFDTHKDLSNAVREGAASIAIDRMAALNWAQNGKHAPRFLHIQTMFLSLLPWLTVLGFVGYCIWATKWMMLFFTPILLLGYLFFQPSFKLTMGPIRILFILSSFVVLGVGLFNNMSGLAILGLSLVIIWYAVNKVFDKAVNSLTKVLLEHEEFLCTLWQLKGCSINLFDGNSYSVDHKYESGEFHRYENGFGD